MEHSTQRDAIRNIQRYLRQLSYTDSSIPSPPIDGIFDDVTRNSLTSFQRSASLPQSGVADRETFSRLYEAYLASLALYSPPLSLNLFPRTPDGYSVSAGDEFFLVGIIQLLLNELRIIYDSFIPLVISGIFDEATEANISDFQSKNGLAANGRVDKATWDSLVRAYNNYTADYVR
ncbi:MAG: peptidoglycan-binding protein [Clostridia bacterium]|nr:peptidoglycan-binding protein [Clostridia bacterium]